MIGAASVAAFVIVLSAPAAAQAPKPAAKPASPAPRLANGTPDLSGVWMGGGGVSERNLKPGDAIMLLPEAKKLVDSRQLKDDPEAHCLPTGVPRMNPYPWRIVQYDRHEVPSGSSSRVTSTATGRSSSTAGRIRRTPTPRGTAIRPASGRGTRLSSTQSDTTTCSGSAPISSHIQHSCTRSSGSPGRISIPCPGTSRSSTRAPTPGRFTVQTRARFEPTWELMGYICQENNTNVGHITQ